MKRIYYFQIWKKMLYNLKAFTWFNKNLLLFPWNWNCCFQTFFRMSATKKSGCIPGILKVFLNLKRNGTFFLLDISEKIEMFISFSSTYFKFWCFKKLSIHWFLKIKFNSLSDFFWIEEISENWFQSICISEP